MLIGAHPAGVLLLASPRWRCAPPAAMCDLGVSVPNARIVDGVADDRTAGAAPRGDAMLVPFWEAAPGEAVRLDRSLAHLDASFGGALSRLLSTSDFTGALGASAAVDLPDFAPFKRCAALGLGKPSDFRTLGDLWTTWGDLIAAYTKARGCALAVAVLPRIEGGLNEAIGYDERGVVGAGLRSGLTPAGQEAAPSAPPLPSGRGADPGSAASPDPGLLGILGKLPGMFKPSGAGPSWPFPEPSTAPIRLSDAARRADAVERGDRRTSDAIAALAAKELAEASGALEEARRAFEEAGADVAQSRAGVVGGLEDAIRAESSAPLVELPGARPTPDASAAKANTFVSGVLVTRRPVSSDAGSCMTPRSFERVAGALAARFVGVEIEVEMLTPAGVPNERLYDGLAPDVSERSDELGAECDARLAAARAAADRDERAASSADLVAGSADLLEPTDDFDVLVLQFQQMGEGGEQGPPLPDRDGPSMARRGDDAGVPREPILIDARPPGCE